MQLSVCPLPNTTQEENAQNLKSGKKATWDTQIQLK